MVDMLTLSSRAVAVTGGRGRALGAGRAAACEAGRQGAAGTGAVALEQNGRSWDTKVQCIGWNRAVDRVYTESVCLGGAEAGRTWG